MAEEKPKRTRTKTTEPKTAKTAKTAKTKTTARKAPARKPAATPRTRRAARTVTHEQIAVRAYHLHLEGHGDAFANWLRAEAELTTA